MDFLADSAFWYSVIRSVTPVLFAALGACITTKASVVNVSLEGTMLISAFVGVIGSAFTGSLLIGMFLALLASVLVAFLMSYFSFNLRANIIMVALAINFAGAGGTVFLLYTLTGDRASATALMSSVFPTVSIPLIENIPFLGKVLSGHNILTYIALLLIFGVYIFLYKTPIGTKIRAVGENPDAAKSVGVNVLRIKTLTLVLGSMMAAFGGMFLSMGYLSTFTSNMTNGRGFIAVATNGMAGGNPLGTAASSFVYGFSTSMSNYMQGSNVPLEFINMFPYLFVIIVYTIFSFRKKIKNKEGFKF
jgi:ABC-type uncharacterized transport system permease subunit